MRAVICGAGIAGLALAQRLSGLHWDVTVLETAPGPRSQGYMMDFFGLGYEAAAAMGVLPRLRELCYQIDEAVYLDGAGRRRAGLDYARFARLMDGRLLSIMRPDLETALREAVADRVDLRFGCGVERIENSDDGVRAATTTGEVLDADLLVGADGIHSTVRRLVFGPEERFVRYLGFHTAAYAITDAAMHRTVGRRFCLTDTTQRQMGLYALRDDRVGVFTVHRAADPAVPPDVREALRREYAGLEWIVPQALEQCPDPAEVYYDQVSQIEIPQWTRQRVTLLGDACQAVSLLAGQGSSLAIAAAFVLGEQLAGVPAAGTIDTALAGYQRRWQPVIAEKQRVARTGVEWFLPSTALRLWARRTALRLSALPGVNRIVGTALVGKSSASLEELSRGDLALTVG